MSNHPVFLFNSFTVQRLNEVESSLYLKKCRRGENGYHAGDYGNRLRAAWLKTGKPIQVGQPEWNEVSDLGIASSMLAGGCPYRPCT